MTRTKLDIEQPIALNLRTGCTPAI